MNETPATQIPPETLRQQIRHSAAHEYSSLPMALLDSFSLRLLRFRRALGRRPPSKDAPSRADLGRYALPSALLIGLLIFLVGLLTAWLAGELNGIQLPKISLADQEAYRQSVDSLSAFMKPWWIHLWAISIGVLTLLGNRAMFTRFLSVFPGRPVGAIYNPADLADLKQWLDENTRPNYYLWISIPGGILVGLFLALVWQYHNAQASLVISLLVVSILSSILAVLALSYIYPFYLVFPSRLGTYKFDLYTNDPSSSEEVQDLGNLYTYIMLITMGLLAYFTLGVYSFKFLTGSTLLFIVLFAWAPTIGFFFISQSNINKIIVANKRATLDALQHQIETMYDLRSINPTDRSAVPTKEDLDRLDKLVGLYERVQGYSNTSLDWRAIINVVTILLLPLITLVLDYLAPIREFFNRITQAGG